MVTPADPAQRLPARTKFAYGVGAIAFGVKDQGFNVLLMLYYNQVIGLPAAWVGAAIMIAMVIDAVADPVIGHWSDNLRSRWGRRHPFMYASALPVAVGYFLLWSPPTGAPELIFAWLLVSAVCVRLAISLFEIPAMALMTEFTSDYDERTSLAKWRSVFLVLGTVGIAVLTFSVLLQPSPEQPVAQLNAAGYARYGAAAALAMLACILFSAWGTHDRILSLKRGESSAAVGMGGLLSDLKTILFDRTFASVLLCAFFFAVATGLGTVVGVYISTYFWRLNGDHLAAISGSGGLGLILSLVAVQISTHLGKKWTAIGLFALALISGTAPVVLGLIGLMPREAASLVPWLMGQTIVYVASMLAAVMLLTSMAADVGDHFRLKTGRHMEGLMFAAIVMINKSVSGLGVFLSGVILSSIGFPEQAVPGEVADAVVDRLALVFVLGVGGLCILAMLALSFYPISRAMHARTLQQLAPG